MLQATIEPQQTTATRSWRWPVVAVATFLLLSFGGAIFAAPITIPLLLWAARRTRSTGYRLWAGVVIVLTAAEVAWALTYLMLGDGSSALWIVPLVATFAVAFGYVAFVRRAHSCEG